jgi:Tfp pilus assembly protein PilV
MRRVSRSSFRAEAGITIIEVMIAALLIGLATGSIMEINAHSLRILQSSHLAAAASQVLQQRVEMLRRATWPELSNDIALAKLMATATESEVELVPAQVTETLTLSVPQDPPTGPQGGSTSVALSRTRGAVTVGQTGDLGTEPSLLVENGIVWKDMTGTHQRSLRTVICRAGLTRNGIFGSSIGRPLEIIPPGT